MNVIICGVVKNASAYLNNNLKLSVELGKLCNTYKIVIYENNSTDSTKDILKSYMNNSNFMIIMEDIDEKVIKYNSKIWAYTAVTGSDHSCRIEQISNARNKLIDEIKNDRYMDFNYVVMIDLDAKNFQINGIINSLNIIKENPNYILYGNSLEYYDYYALRSPHSEHHLFGPEVMGEVFWQNIKNKKLKIDNRSSKLVEVYSAFNGIGVYSKDAFIKFTYSAIVTSDVKILYDQMAQTHPYIYEKYKTILQSNCPRFNGGGEITDKFCFKSNSGYNKPVICEHVSFNFSLLNAGYKIFINPCMLYWWNC